MGTGAEEKKAAQQAAGSQVRQGHLTQDQLWSQTLVAPWVLPFSAYPGEILQLSHSLDFGYVKMGTNHYLA